MRLIDSHSHLDFEDFDDDRNTVIQTALNKGVSDIIVSATVAKRWSGIQLLCAEHSGICHPAYGLHPMFMNEHQLSKTDNDIHALEQWLDNNHAVAIGEIGLDFFIPEAQDNSRRDDQISLFAKQLSIANEHNLPVIIHARKSLDIVLKHLRQYPNLRGVIHSFSGSEQQAKQLIDLGYYLSFGGPITYSRATRLQKIIKALPLDALLLESDAPDQPDSGHYQQRNEPAYIVKVAEAISELKGCSVNEVGEVTTQNAIDIYKFDCTKRY